MLMAAFGLSTQDALTLLRAVSQANNVKLREVARHIVERWSAAGPEDIRCSRPPGAVVTPVG
jgi:hypothetical protein